ncbi:MAG: HlyD family efflux transporter periplasmic adaptor subunit [Symploca sp. SIO2E6]|nr:HlyD family efflux transporter periplasmic adaptor subunit [Symploca sp. SIO2E6]
MKTEDTKLPREPQPPEAVSQNTEEEIAAQVEELVSESLEDYEEKRPLWPDVPWTPITKKNRWSFSLFLVIMVIAALLGLKAFTLLRNRSTSEETETVALEAQLPVKVVQVKTEPIQEWVFSDAEVRASRFKHLTLDVAGTITYIKDVNGRDLQEGDYVQGGELLAKVDQRKSDQDLNVAKAAVFEAKQQVETAKASLRQAQNQLIQAEAELRQAETNRDFAATDLKRYQELYQEGAIQGREVEVRKTDLTNNQTAVVAKEAAVKSAQEGVTSADAQVQAAQSGVNSALAQLGKTEVNREDTEIKAPFNSQVAHLNIKEGDYWTPQRVQTTGDYQNIVESVPIIVIDPSSFEIYAQLPAFQGISVKPGQRAFVVLDQDQSKASSGRVTSDDLIKLAAARGRVESVSPSVSPGERSVEVRVEITEGAANLQDGSHVSVWIAVEERNDATVAPFNTFVFRDQIPHVFVIKEENGKKVVEQRKVEPGIEGISKREILQGVKPGELLVTDGKNRLVDGAPVDVVEISNDN